MQTPSGCHEGHIKDDAMMVGMDARQLRKGRIDAPGIHGQSVAPIAPRQMASLWVSPAMSADRC
jgi:hypothetical protein